MVGFKQCTSKIFDCMLSNRLEGVLELEPLRNLKRLNDELFVFLQADEESFKFLSQFVMCEQLKIIMKNYYA